MKQRYIGESKRPIGNWIADHRGEIVNKNNDKATGAHFNLPGRSLDNIEFTILEQVKRNDESYRRERERYLINKFNTFHKGLNRQVNSIWEVGRLSNIVILFFTT